MKKQIFFYGFISYVFRSRYNMDTYINTSAVKSDATPIVEGVYSGDLKWCALRGALYHYSYRWIPLYNEISLALELTPPEGPGEGYLEVPEYLNNITLRNNMG